MYLQLSEYGNQHFYIASGKSCPSTKIQTEYYCQTENLKLENTKVETTSNALIKKYMLQELGVGTSHRIVKKQVEPIDGRGKFSTVFEQQGYTTSEASDLKLLLCSANIGNEMPFDLDPWIPEGGGKHDIIVIGMQESTFTVTSLEVALEKLERAKGGESEEEEIPSVPNSPTINSTNLSAPIPSTSPTTSPTTMSSTTSSNNTSQSQSGVETEAQTQTDWSMAHR